MENEAEVNRETSTAFNPPANQRSRRQVRSLPPWVRSIENEGEGHTAPSGDTITPPPPILRGVQHSKPSANSRLKPSTEKGRLKDIYRERTAVTIDSPVRQHIQQWQAFAFVSAAPNTSDKGAKVDAQWMRDNTADLEGAWTGQDDEVGKRGDTLWKPRKGVWYKRAQTTLLRNPMMPLLLRLVIWIFSLVALALGGSIYRLSRDFDFIQRPSTIMAIAVDSIALIYLLYITYDEYTGKPLGLRSPAAKMRLILLDLFFIVFDSANLSLSFDALEDVRWSCKSDGSGAGSELTTNYQLCHRQKTLSAVLLVALVAWLLTFTVSLLRLVERVSRA
ncbi:MAG: hypothetical protein M1829_002170 [Trizodia sp. TS-e1964]|nr:MAG: hypothetical protein M1829_002170 [Trizodia sp. TS-e1964]